MTRAVTLAEIADTNTFVVDGTNNRVGINSSIPTTTLDVGGAIKATSFTGNVTGNATGLTGTPDIAVRNITGVAATFTGLLTYEDVTNIDSVGIVTARTGVRIADGGLIVTAGVSTFAADISIADKIIHTGDPNTAIRFPANDTVTVETAGTERLRVDSNGDVGINETSPETHLHVEQDNAHSSTYYTNADAAILLQNNNTGASAKTVLKLEAPPSSSDCAIVYGGGTTNLIFADRQNERLRITSDGKMGLGTNSPSQILEIKAVEPRICLQGTTGNNSKGIEFEHNGTRYASIFHNQGNGDFTISSGDNGSGYFINFKTNNIEAARFDPSGRMLVGALVEGAPAADNLTLQDSGSCGLTIRAGTSDYSTIYLSDATSGTGEYAGSIQYGHADNALRIGTNSVERLRIDSTGMLRTFSSTANGVLNIMTSQGASTSANLIVGHHSSTNVTNGTLSFLVFTNGNVQNTNNSYGQISDQKLKENIVDANSQWDNIKGVRVRNFNFIEGQTHTQIGVVAQELEVVSPGLIDESPDRDAEDKDLGTVTKSVKYSVLYMKAVKALQEAMTRIETLETKVAALEG